MKNNLILLVTLLSLLCCDFVSAQAPSLNRVFHQNKLFLENKGQLAPYQIGWKGSGEIRYYSQNFSGTAYFADNGIGFGFQREIKDTAADLTKVLSNHTGFFLEFIDKNPTAQLIGENQQVAVFNYYHDESHVSGVKTFSNILYKGLYSHIDLKYSCAGTGLKFDYILHPGSKMTDIKLQYTGVKKTSINKSGDMEILTDWGILTDKKPYSYQVINGKKEKVDVAFKKNDAGLVNFEVIGKYNPKVDLIIDPYTLTWGTYIGGTSNGSDGYHYDITMDNQGNVYGAGWYAPDFPMVNAASTNSNTIQPFVYKMSADGTTLLFATYCGGDATGDDEIGSSVCVNPAGDVFLCGYTNNATNFPKAGTPVSSTIAGGADIFVARFTATGALVFTTFYGGPGDDRAYDMNVDASNNLFITGFTSSNSGFATPGAFQTTYGGGPMDAFLLKLNYTGSAVGFSTYLGGSGQDLGRGVAIDLSGNVYVGGVTESTSGISTAGSFKTSYGGGSSDGFIAKFNNGGSRIYGAYVGGTMGDKVESVVTKCNGEIVISGWTYSASGSFPSVNAIQPENGTGNPIDGGRDGFMCRITANGTKKLNSTYIGGPADDANKNGGAFDFKNQQLGTCVSVNRIGNIAFCMNTNSTLPVVNPTKAAPSGTSAAYLFITDTAGSKMTFATYFGGDLRSYPTGGIKYHPTNDNVFVLGGSSHSSDGTIQMTAGSYMPMHGSPAGGTTGLDQPFLVLYTQPVCTMKVSLPVPDPVCKNTAVTFTADTLCGGKTPTLKWLVNGVVVAGATGTSYTSSTLNNGDNVCVVFSKAIPTCVPTFDSAKTCVSVVITPPITLSFTQNNVKCKGDNTGSITVSASSGTAPYAYSKDGVTFVSSGTFGTLTAGVYTITIKDAKNCTNTQSITISEPPPLVVTTTSTNVNCNGGADGTATSSVSGGSPSYTYSWNTPVIQTSPSATALSTGTYVLTVTDANACVKTASVTIIEPPALIASATATDVTCNGTADGTATASATGGVGPYTYSWNSNPVQTSSKATALAEGNYTVTVTDAKNCTKTAGITIGKPLTLSAAATAADAVCGAKNGSVSVTATGGVTPYSYSWNTSPVQTTASVTGLGPGNYTVSVTDANGCNKTATATVTSPSGITATTSSVATTCSSSSDGSALVTPSGGNAPYTYAWSTIPAQTTASATALASGIYSVSITDSKGCSYTASVTVNSPPDIVITTTTVNTTCSNSSDGSATASASGGTPAYTFSWNTSAVQAGASASNLASGSYVVAVTDSKGCSKKASTTVASPNPLTANALATNISCNGGSDGTATVTANGGTGPYTYSWNTSPVQTTSTATGLGAGTYTVTVKDASGCLQTASATVALPLAITINITSTNINCGATNGGATATVTGGTGPFSYSWNSSPVQTTATAAGLGAGTYTVNVTDSKGCNKSANATITSASGLLANPSAIPAKCKGSLDGSISANGTGGTPPYTYSWNTNPVQTTATVTGLGAGNYNLTLTDSKGCLFSASTTVTEPPILSVSTTTKNALCSNASDGTATASVTGGTMPYSYSWNTTPIQTSLTASTLTQGSYVVTVQDANGCTGNATAVVGSPPALVIAVAVTNVTCNGASDGTATVTAGGGTGPYTYSIDGSKFVSNPLFITISPGNYTLTVKDANACQNTKSIVISEPSKITTTLIPADVLCFGVPSGNIQATASNGTSPYVYSIDGITFSQNGFFSNLGSGSYSVKVKDANNCMLSFPVSIGSAPALQIKIVSETDIICTTPGSITSSANGGKAPYLYSINTGSYVSSSVFNNLDTGKYTLKVKDANGCIQSVDTAVHPYKSTATVVVSVNGSDKACVGQKTELVSNKSTGNVWYPNGETTQSIFVTVSGTYYVIAPDPLSCLLKSNPVTVQILPKPEVKPGKGTEICEGTSTQLGGDPIAGYTYNWTSDPAGFKSTLANPMVQPVLNTKYSLTVNNQGCIASDTVSIAVKKDPEFYIPNAFSPNDDGLNDVFKASSDQQIDITGTIFNRWGEKIFEWHNLENGWDGKIKTETNLIDVFVYIIKGKGSCSKTYTRTGTVTIVK